MSEVVRVENVWFSYQAQPVLENVSLTVQAGEFVGLIGPNGSGKTTLLHLMLGLERPDRGTVTLFGEPAWEFDDGHRLGYVSQRSTDRGSAMPATVNEVVSMGRFAHCGRNRLTANDREAIQRAMDIVNITELADDRINRLSGGQRQRAFIARALASEADFLALDEPTVGLDVGSRDDFYGLLAELNDQGITVLLIEHDVDIITNYVDTVACINRELHYHGDSMEFLDSGALSEAYGDNHALLRHNHP